MRGWLIGGLLIVTVSWTGLAWAQGDPCAGTPPSGTVHNPTRLCFQSPDHASATAYAVEYWLQGVDPTTGAPVQTFGLPISAVTSGGSGYTALLSALTPLPAMPTGQTYVIRMTLTGATGVSPRSDATNPFDFPAVPQPAQGVSVR